MLNEQTYSVGVKGGNIKKDLIGIIALKGIRYNCGENWYDFTYHKWMDIIESIMDIVKFGID